MADENGKRIKPLPSQLDIKKRKSIKRKYQEISPYKPTLEDLHDSIGALPLNELSSRFFSLKNQSNSPRMTPKVSSSDYYLAMFTEESIEDREEELVGSLPLKDLRGRYEDLILCAMDESSANKSNVSNFLSSDSFEHDEDGIGAFSCQKLESEYTKLLMIARGLGGDVGALSQSKLSDDDAYLRKTGQLLGFDDCGACPIQENMLHLSNLNQCALKIGPDVGADNLTSLTTHWMNEGRIASCFGPDIGILPQLTLMDDHIKLVEIGKGFHDDVGIDNIPHLVGEYKRMKICSQEVGQDVGSNCVMDLQRPYQEYMKCGSQIGSDIGHIGTDEILSQYKSLDRIGTKIGDDIGGNDINQLQNHFNYLNNAAEEVHIRPVTAVRRPSSIAPGVCTDIGALPIHDLRNRFDNLSQDGIFFSSNESIGQLSQSALSANFMALRKAAMTQH